MKDLKYEHQSIKVGGWWGGWKVGGWRFHGMGRVWWCGWWLEGSWGRCIYPPTHEQLQCQNISFYEHPPTHQTSKVSLYYYTYTHPHMNSYDVIFHFMNTHPPIKHIQSVTLSLYIYFGWFMGWVVVGWLEGSLGG